MQAIVELVKEPGLLVGSLLQLFTTQRWKRLMNLSCSRLGQSLRSRFRSRGSAVQRQRQTTISGAHLALLADSWSRRAIVADSLHINTCPGPRVSATASWACGSREDASLRQNVPNTTCRAMTCRASKNEAETMKRSVEVLCVQWSECPYRIQLNRKKQPLPK